MPTRRSFMKSSCIGLGGLSAATWLPASRAAADVDLPKNMVRLTPDLEPLVRLIERTPRPKALNVIGDELRKGLPYRKLLAALYLAGIRNVNPQPPGFKFHCVFVMHAAHQTSLDAAPGQRLLPLLWALDNFKASQQRDVAEGDFHLKKVRGKLPLPQHAWKEFDEAMEAWDEERADRAIVSLVRHAGSHEIVEGLWRYGARDYRNIGHKAIFVANTWRTLQTIGWRHAEPALRSLVLGLLDFGKSERLNGYAFEDQSFRMNSQLAVAAGSNLPSGWTIRKGSPRAVQDIVAMIRGGDFKKVCQNVLADIQREALGGDTVWDAIHLAAGELMMRQPGIYGIHTVTSVNGLHYAYQSSLQAETRLVLLLQGLGWMCQFRNFMAKNRGGLNKFKITNIEPADSSQSQYEMLEEIFGLIGQDNRKAAERAYAYAHAGHDVDIFRNVARRMLMRKGSDAHDYKYSISIFEDFARVENRWRPHMLATAVYNLKGANSKDNPLMQRAQEVVKRLT